MCASGVNLWFIIQNQGKTSRTEGDIQQSHTYQLSLCLSLTLPIFTRCNPVISCPGNRPDCCYATRTVLPGQDVGAWRVWCKLPTKPPLVEPRKCQAHACLWLYQPTMVQHLKCARSQCCHKQMAVAIELEFVLNWVTYCHIWRFLQYFCNKYFTEAVNYCV